MPEPRLTLLVPVDPRAAAIWQGMWEQGQLKAVDWEEVFYTAEADNALPALYDAIRRNGYTTYIPQAVLNHMEQVYRRTQVVNVTLRENLRRTLSLLDANHIPVIVLKGAALAELVYGDIGLRPMSDLDLLVRPKHAERAVACLRAEAYQLSNTPEQRVDNDPKVRVETQLISPKPFPCVVDIHWRIIEPLFACLHVDYDKLWKRAVKSTIVGQPAYTLGAEDWVLHQAAHAFFKHHRISWLTLIDLDRLIRYLDKRLDWEALVKIGADFHWLPALAAVLPPLVSFCNSPVPKWVIQAASAYHLSAVERQLLRSWLKPGHPESRQVFPD